MQIKAAPFRVQPFFFHTGGLMPSGDKIIRELSKNYLGCFADARHLFFVFSHEFKVSCLSKILIGMNQPFTGER
jgi:hypothetical protein